MKLKIILQIVWSIIPKDYLVEVLIELLRKAAEKTETKWDDEKVDMLSEIYYKLKARRQK